MKFIVYVLLLNLGLGRAQEKLPFADEVIEIEKQYASIQNNSKETIVFTGSSSIRLWRDLSDKFPEHQIVNSGFGGSKTSDLLLHSQALILNFNPKKVFIYEGDNDIAGKVKVKAILEQMSKLITQIKTENNATQIVLIAVKPSITRWNLRSKYKRLNRKFAKLASTDASIDFANVWRPMLNGKKLRKNLFIEDGLHMNAKGYDIWYSVMKPFM